MKISPWKSILSQLHQSEMFILQTHPSWFYVIHSLYASHAIVLSSCLVWCLMTLFYFNIIVRVSSTVPTMIRYITSNLLGKLLWKWPIWLNLSPIQTAFEIRTVISNIYGIMKQLTLIGPVPDISKEIFFTSSYKPEGLLTNSGQRFSWLLLHIIW